MEKGRQNYFRLMDKLFFCVRPPTTRNDNNKKFVGGKVYERLGAAWRRLDRALIDSLAQLLGDDDRNRLSNSLDVEFHPKN